MTQITTVIFDMYETLVEEGRHHWRKTFNEITRQQDLNVDPELLWDTWWEAIRAFRANRTSPGIPFESYYHAWRNGFSSAFRTLRLPGDPSAAIDKSMQDLSKRQPYVETMQTLRIIQSQYRTAILSNADEVYFRANLRLLDGDIVAGLSLALTSEEAQCYKPQRAFFQEMLRRLKVTPQECLYVGDRQLEDVKGADSVGIGTVWLNRSGIRLDRELPTPHYQIKSLSEIPQILEIIADTKDGSQ